MRYLVSLLLGLLLGVALFAIGLVYNPFIANRGLSPISVTDAQVMSLSFSGVPGDSIVYTNDGESRQKPHPEKVSQLWEAPIRLTTALVTTVNNARGQPAGVGVKFSSRSEKTRLLNGEAIVDSAWYIYLPGRGSMFIEQSENHWMYLRDIVFPAYRSAAKSWKGSWLGDLTHGPGALGLARVTGGSGSLQGLEMDAVESLSVRAYSAESGPVAAEGRLLIEMPVRHADLAEDLGSE